MPQRLDQLQKLYDLDPSDPFVTYGIALEKGKAGQFADAIQWLDKTLQLDCHYHYAYFQKAKMLSETGDDTTAKAVLEAGLRIAHEDDDAQAKRELAELLESLNE